MEALHPAISLDRFFVDLAKAVERVLMLDYDGTLAPFHEERDRAIPYPGVRERLTHLVESDRTRVIIISGRRANDLESLLGLDTLPEIWGCHGAERLLPDESYQLVPLSDRVSRGLKEIDIWAEKEKLEDYLERKPAGRAFHWRGRGEETAGKIRSAVIGDWAARAGLFELSVHEFDGGLELRAEGIDKGRVVKTVLSEVQSGAVIAYCGDDHTDEDAFNALADRGLRVLVRPEIRETAADLWINPPEELLEFLDRWSLASSIK
jgi:trehalose 6-phosphate phosphatase